MALVEIGFHVNTSGPDGNVFNVIAQVSNILREALPVIGYTEIQVNNTIKEFRDKALSSKSYKEVLNLCCEYVDFSWE